MAYVYRHIRLDNNEPFYIGIGSDSSYKRANERARRSTFWKKIVSKCGYKVQIIIDEVSYDFAKEKEKEFILLYGRKDLNTGSLCNLTDGGDGTANLVFTSEHKVRLSISAKNRYKDREIKTKLTKQEQNELSRKRMLLRNPCKGILKDKHHSFKGNITVYKDGGLIGEYIGVVDCEERLGVSRSKVSACLTGKRKSHKGYTFERKQ